MTDTELNTLEAKAKEEHPASWYVLDLIAEIRQLRKERDWIIVNALNNADLCVRKHDCPTDDVNDEVCMECWRKAAREATCQKD